MTFKKIHIFSTNHQWTTARYFERAVKAEGLECVYWDSVPNLSEIDPQDLFLYIDPALDWPLGLEMLDCCKAAYFIDVHQGLDERLKLSKFFDLVFIAQKAYLGAFRAKGIADVFWLPLACDPEIHAQGVEPRIYDVGFVGKLGNQGTWRYSILNNVLSKYAVNDYKRYYPPLAMGEVYGQSKIVFNASINKDLNMRFFEALASGALLVTDRSPEGINDLFEENIHYVAYDTDVDALEIINYYLANNESREKVSSAGNKAVLEGHTYRHRWQTILGYAEGYVREFPLKEMTREELSDLYSEIFVSMRLPLRILEVIKKYGITRLACKNLIVALGRLVNSIVPLTPNAIRARFARN